MENTGFQQIKRQRRNAHDFDEATIVPISATESTRTALHDTKAYLDPIHCLSHALGFPIRTEAQEHREISQLIPRRPRANLNAIESLERQPSTSFRTCSRGLDKKAALVSASPKPAFTRLGQSKARPQISRQPFDRSTSFFDQKESPTWGSNPQP